MPEETDESEDAPENPQEPEETPEETSQGEEETPEETSKKEEQEPTKKPELSDREKRFLARAKRAEKKLRETKETRTPQEVPKPIPSKDSRSAEDEAKAYLRRITEEVLADKDAEIKAKEKEEDEKYQVMLDDFADTDPDFDPVKFGKLVEKYKPADEDASWKLWEDLGKKPLSSSKEKPKLPQGKKTTDEVKKDLFTEKEITGTRMDSLVEKAKGKFGIK